MQEVKHYPHGRSFVAVWHVPARNELFCASFHYKDGQYFTYDETMDDFIPEGDHGYTPMFFKRMKARFFVTDVDGEPTWHIEEDWQDSVDIKEAPEWATLLVHVKTPTLDVMAWVNHDDTHFQYINSSTEISGEIIGRWKPTNQVAIVGYKTV